MKKLLLFIIVSLLYSQIIYSQDVTVENVKGVGLTRTDATQDALRNAVGEAFGTVVQSSTIVENYNVVKDAISTRTQGVVTSYKVTKEVPYKDRYEVFITAQVSSQAIKQNAATLSQMVGGLKFLVMYDDRKLNAEEKEYYNYCYERINEKLAEKQYSYTESTIFTNLESLLKNDTSEISYINNMGLYSNSEFIIQIKKITVRTKEASLNSDYKVIIDLKAYDNCTATGLGTITSESDWMNLSDKQQAINLAIKDALNKYYDRLFMLFSNYMETWINNGAPYELRFYGFDLDDGVWFTYEDLLKADTDTKEDPMDTKAGTYLKINLKSIKTPYNLSRLAFMKFADVPELKALAPTYAIKYGRQYSFIPKGANIPEIQAKIENLKRINKQ